MKIFFFQYSHFNIIRMIIYMAFYLVICFIIYFNDIKMGRNILINFELKGILFISSHKKK